MGTLRINGWSNINPVTIVLVTGDNTPTAFEYSILVPVEADSRVIGFEMADIDPDLDEWWITEVANGDAGYAMDILLIGGLPSQSPLEIVLPPGFSQLRIKPGYAQRVVFVPGVGWIPLLPGTPEA